MAVMLAPTPILIVDPEAVPDEHGWADPATPDWTGKHPVVWSGQGNMQEDRNPTGDRSMASGGGGAYDPATGASARAYLPEVCPVKPGHLLVAADDPVPWLVATVRLSRDPVALLFTPPAGVAGLTAVVATLVRASRGGEGDLP